MGAAGTLTQIDARTIEPNPNNPRRFFNEERLDLLRTSIQEVGILVPLIVYEKQHGTAEYVLMDGERRWRCALDLALTAVPANIIETPTELENLLRMFNIHNVREDWPLVSIALSLKEVISLSSEQGEKRLSELTGLTRSTVRRAKRILLLPPEEVKLILAEAHLDRSKQIHREDLYLEIEAAESIIRTKLSELAAEYSRPQIIRAFAKKAEQQSLSAVTDFRYVPKLIKAGEEGIVEHRVIVDATRQMIEDVNTSPKEVFNSLAATAYKGLSLQRKSDVLTDELREYVGSATLTDALRDRLCALRDLIDELLKDG